MTDYFLFRHEISNLNLSRIRPPYRNAILSIHTPLPNQLLTGEQLPNWSMLSCLFRLFRTPSSNSTQSREVPWMTFFHVFFFLFVLFCLSKTARFTFSMGWRSKRCLGTRLVSVRWRCPNHSSLRFLMFCEHWLFILWVVHTYLWYVVTRVIYKIFLWHLTSAASNLASSLSVRLQRSAANNRVERSNELWNFNLDTQVEVLIFSNLLQVSERPCCFASSVVELYWHLYTYHQ